MVITVSRSISMWAGTRRTGLAGRALRPRVGRSRRESPRATRSSEPRAAQVARAVAARIAALASSDSRSRGAPCRARRQGRREELRRAPASPANPPCALASPITRPATAPPPQPRWRQRPCARRAPAGSSERRQGKSRRRCRRLPRPAAPARSLRHGAAGPGPRWGAAMSAARGPFGRLVRGHRAIGAASQHSPRAIRRMGGCGDPSKSRRTR